MKTINVGHGRYAMVDDQDFEWLSKWRWRIAIVKSKGEPQMYYAARTAYLGINHQPKSTTVFMHREIGKRIGFSTEKDTDHRDLNGLNNQRENLRECSQSQNNGNRRKERGCSSKFKGVSFDSERNKWMVYIAGKYLGRFKTEVEAAQIYDVEAVKYFGSFARVNFPGETVIH